MNRCKHSLFGCRASGIIFYRIINDELHFLLQRVKNNSVYEDLGGKIDITDNNIWMTAVREAVEESNGVIYGKTVDECRNYIMNLTERHAYLNTKIKYALFLVHLPGDDNYDFGDCEYASGFTINRTIEWISINTIKNKGNKILHPRIRHIFNVI